MSTRFMVESFSKYVVLIQYYFLRQSSIVALSNGLLDCLGNWPVDSAAHLQLLKYFIFRNPCPKVRECFLRPNGIRIHLPCAKRTGPHGYETRSINLSEGIRFSFDLNSPRYCIYVPQNCASSVGSLALLGRYKSTQN